MRYRITIETTDDEGNTEVTGRYGADICAALVNAMDAHEALNDTTFTLLDRAMCIDGALNEGDDADALLLLVAARRLLRRQSVCKASVPRYLCRPLVRNFPGRLAMVSHPCPFCGVACYKAPQEPDVLPENVVACCTRCALERAK